VIVVGVFEDAVIKAKVAADYAGKKTGEFVEISKLRIYKASKEHTDCTEYVQEKATAIDALYAEFTEINNKINDLRNVKKCPQCSYINQQEAEFCIKCGIKL
jgi:hypothetical protein